MGDMKLSAAKTAKLSERLYDGEFDVEVGEEVCMADKRVIAEVRVLEQALEEAQKANKNLKVQRDTIVANARAEREGLEAALEEAREALATRGMLADSNAALANYMREERDAARRALESAQQINEELVRESRLRRLILDRVSAERAVARLAALRECLTVVNEQTNDTWYSDGIQALIDAELAKGGA